MVGYLGRSIASGVCSGAYWISDFRLISSRSESLWWEWIRTYRRQLDEPIYKWAMVMENQNIVQVPNYVHRLIGCIQAYWGKSEMKDIARKML
jgi:hypothetical protein